MKILDIRNAITKKLNSNGHKIYYENIDKVKKPCFFINLVDYNKEFNTFYREKKRITFDLLYFPKEEKMPNTEIITALEQIDEEFEVMGTKTLRVQDRSLNLKNTFINITDQVGHYIFDIELFDIYGKPIDYELMNDLNLKFK